MMFNRATLDKYLLAFFIGSGMIVLGLSSTDRWWIAIGGVVVGLTVVFAAIDIYGWIRGRKGDNESDARPPSKMRVVLMLPVCLLIAAGLIVLGGSEGIALAVLLVLSYAVLAFLTFWEASPLTLLSFTNSKPIGSGVLEHDGKLFAAMTGDPQQDEETLRKYLAENPALLDGALGKTLNTLTGGRLEEIAAQAGKDVSVERTPDGFVARRDIRIDLSPSAGTVLEQLASAITGKAPAQRDHESAETETGATETAESLLAQGDERKARGKEAEARKAYEEAEVLAIVDRASGNTRDYGLLPTVLVRLGKLEAARKLIEEDLALAPDDPKLLAAQALLASAPDKAGK